VPAAPPAAIPAAHAHYPRPPFPTRRPVPSRISGGDLIIGDNHLSTLGTLVERQTRTLRLVHLPRADSDSLHTALVDRMQDLPPELMRSITWDQGTEMARHLATADKRGAPVYFCDSRSPWQRGTNENTNGLLRDYFPEGVTLANYSLDHLVAVGGTQSTSPNGPPRRLPGGSIRRPASVKRLPGDRLRRRAVRPSARSFVVGFSSSAQPRGTCWRR
jgi:IS30 family transposase